MTVLFHGPFPRRNAILLLGGPVDALTGPRIKISSIGFFCGYQQAAASAAASSTCVFSLSLVLYGNRKPRPRSRPFGPWPRPRLRDRVYMGISKPRPRLCPRVYSHNCKLQSRGSGRGSSGRGRGRGSEIGSSGRQQAAASAAAMSTWVSEIGKFFYSCTAPAVASAARMCGY